MVEIDLRTAAVVQIENRQPTMVALMPYAQVAYAIGRLQITARVGGRCGRGLSERVERRGGDY